MLKRLLISAVIIITMLVMYDDVYGLEIANKDNLVVIDKRITSEVKQQYNQIIKLVVAGNKEIFIKIDSSGGETFYGNKIVSIIRGAKEHGVTLTCIVEGKAMSAALVIFSECDNRYAVFGSVVMWHSVRYNFIQDVDIVKAKFIVDDLIESNDLAWAETRSYFTPWYFSENFRSERIIDVTEIERKGFNYLKVINKITYKKQEEKDDGKSNRKEK